MTENGETVKRAVVLGEEQTVNGEAMVEVVTGLNGGEEVVAGNE